MPTSGRIQRYRDEALRLSAEQGHIMGDFTTRGGIAVAICRECGATAVVTRAGIKERPPTSDRGWGGGAPFFPCPRDGN